MALDLPSYLLGKKKGGGGGTSDYSQLTNKPSINGVTLSGNKTGADLGIGGDYDIRVICAKNTPTQDDLADASKLINDLYYIANNGDLNDTKIVIISTNPSGYAKLHETIPSAYSLKQKSNGYSFYATAVHNYNDSSNKWCGTTELNISGSWSNNVFTASRIVAYGNTGNEVVVLSTNNTKAYTPIAGSYQPATAKYVEDVANPVVTTSSASTYTIASLDGNQTYKLGTITSLTITATTTFDKESVIYFESGSTATSISIPDSITNLGDVPTLTTASNVSTGTCDANKKYIIAILNNIAVWKKY